MPHLLLSPRRTPDAARLSAAATARGWSVQRLEGWRPPSDARLPDALALYGEPLFARVVAAQAGRALLEPPHDWLARVPRAYARRAIAMTTLGGLEGLSWPRFVKPPDDKLFPAQVYRSAAEVWAGRSDLTGDEPALVSEPVSFRSEFRVFMWRGQAVACSRYAVEGGELSLSGSDPDCAEARRVAEEVAAATPEWTPPSVVIDVGRLMDGAWAVIEANPCFGAGLYEADPDPVLDVLLEACRQEPGEGLERFLYPVVLE